MSENRIEELKGWPLSWYEGENGTGYLRCPARGCDKVFKTAKEMEQRLQHYSWPEEDEDIAFDHVILAAMCAVQICPKCGVVPSHVGTHDNDTRPHFKHELDVHKTERLSDIKGFIGLIREYRSLDFPYGNLDENVIELWSKLYQYFRRNIIRQPDYHVLHNFLLDQRDLKRSKDILCTVTYTDSDFLGLTGEDLENCKVVYPVHKDAFLSKWRPTHLPRYPTGHIVDTMKARYAKGDF